MAKSLQERNRMECNRKARKKYDKANFKYQSVLFKIEEIEAINDYCERHGIPKNTFFRETTMNAIGRTID